MSCTRWSHCAIFYSSHYWSVIQWLRHFASGPQAFQISTFWVWIPLETKLFRKWSQLGLACENPFEDFRFANRFFPPPSCADGAHIVDIILNKPLKQTRWWFAVVDWAYCYWSLAGIINSFIFHSDATYRRNWMSLTTGQTSLNNYLCTLWPSLDRKTSRKLLRWAEWRWKILTGM